MFNSLSVHDYDQDERVCLFDQVSAVGHAAMFAAIKKYMPNLVCI